MRISICDIPRNLPKADPGPSPSKNASPCLLCGRWILDPSKAQMVHYATSGELLFDEDDAPDSQGWFPVGADCARRIRRAQAQGRGPR